jgi:hypothetical protein
MSVASAKSDDRASQVPARIALIRQAFRLEWLTVSWMMIEVTSPVCCGLIGLLDQTARILLSQPDASPPSDPSRRRQKNGAFKSIEDLRQLGAFTFLVASLSPRVTRERSVARSNPALARKASCLRGAPPESSPLQPDRSKWRGSRATRGIDGGPPFNARSTTARMFS